MNETTRETSAMLQDLLLLAGSDVTTALHLLAGLLLSNQREFKRICKIMSVYAETSRIVESRKTAISYSDAETVQQPALSGI